MSVRVVLGIQWGDEGKGKIVDLLSDDADIVARFQGGPNAGHTLVVNGETTVLHLIPSGILHPGLTCVLGNGVVINLEGLFGELDRLSARGVRWEDRLWVSERAHLILPAHRAMEEHEERGAGAVGTTLRGIGPAYRDKMARIGITVGEFLDRERFLEALDRQREWRRRSVPELPPDSVAPEAVEAVLGPFRERIRSMVRDTGYFLAAAAKEGKRVLLEGAQGTMLDVDHGTYPFVTSSSAAIGGACTGTGVAPRYIDDAIGVTKAYATRVGLGPFPTELIGAEGDRLRGAGAEFGATTGRPRRCGWLDGVALRHAVRVNGLDALAVTKLDVLSGQDTVRLAVAYRRGNEIIPEFPGRVSLLGEVEPVYEEFPGWHEDLSGCRTWGDLPETARAFLERIRQVVDTPLRLISVGQERDATIRVS